MPQFSPSTVRLHAAALDHIEKAIQALPVSNPDRAQTLTNVSIARDMLGLNPPNVRASYQVFREVRSAIPDYDKTNPTLFRAIEAARDAAQP